MAGPDLRTPDAIARAVDEAANHYRQGRLDDADKLCTRVLKAAPDWFDAVLSDSAMPDITGAELAEKIRAVRSDIPIVLMSGFVSPALAAQAEATGVLEVLAKPLTSRDVARSLANALRRTNVT